MTQNVFEDIGFSLEEAATLKIKADLHTKVVKCAAGYTQLELQKILGATQPRISDLLRGKMSRSSLEMLLIYAQKLGLQAQIRTTRPRKQASSRRLTAAATNPAR